VLRERAEVEGGGLEAGLPALKEGRGRLEGEGDGEKERRKEDILELRL